MSSVEWRIVRHHLTLALFPINVCLNVALLYIIKTHSIKALDRYKKILYLSACYDIFYSTIAAVCLPTFYIKNGYYFVITEGIFGLQPEPWNGIAYSLYHFSMYMCVAIVPVQFIYRFVLLCFGQRMGWIPFCFLFIIAEGICGWNSYRRFSEFLSQHSQIQDDVVRSIGWFNNDTGELYSYGSFSLVTNNTVSYGILIVSYIIIIFCSLAVYVRLKLQVSALHYTDVKIYRQTSITLFMEALIPFVIVVVPILANLLAVSFKYSTAWLDSLLVTIAVLGPFFNSITKLTVIKVYRNTVLTWLHIRRPKVVNLSSINRNSQVQNSKLQDNLVNDTTHAKMCSIH